MIIGIATNWSKIIKIRLKAKNKYTSRLSLKLKVLNFKANKGNSAFINKLNKIVIVINTYLF